MADEPRKPAEETPAAPPARRQWLARLTDPKSLWLVAAVTISVHALGLAISWYRTSGADAAATGEVSLGQFHFSEAAPTAAGIRAARFEVHLELLPDLEAMARDRLQLHRFKVQQEVEELLRQAHGTDFDDPLLAELKRQIQERISEALELRAIREVLITDAKIERTAAAAEVAQGQPDPSPPPIQVNPPAPPATGG